MSSRMRVKLQPSFILQTRAYRDTSLLVDIFSQDYGRIHGIFHGVLSSRSRFRGLTQPFFPLMVSWSGKPQCVTIQAVEPMGEAYWLTGKVLISAFYLNELLMRLFHPCDPYPEAYTIYLRALAELNKDKRNIEPVLRHFEFDLLKILGVGLVLSKTYDTHETVIENAHYIVKPESGVTRATNKATSDTQYWSGRSLLDIEKRDFSKTQTQREAKKLIRLLLQPLLGDRPLNVRRVFEKCY